MNTEDQNDQNTAIEQLGAVARLRSGDKYEPQTVGLDSRVSTLAGLGAALALCSPFPILRSLAEQAMAAGATAEEVLGVLVAVAPTIGTARVVANTSTLALALGYDVDAALEDTEIAAGE
jgi:alkylhydroperoxidase/carboxymuconolactone decarboxylase family protein YurZ